MIKQAVLLGGVTVLNRNAETLPVLDEMLGVHLLRRLIGQGIGRILLSGCAAGLESLITGADIEICEKDQLPDHVASWRGDVLVCTAACLTDIDLRGIGTIDGQSVALLHGGRPYPGDRIAVRDGSGRIVAVRDAEPDERDGVPVCTGMAAVRAERLAELGCEALEPVGMRSRMIGGYWRAVRNEADYAEVQQALLEGRARLPVAGRRCGIAIIGDGADIAPGVKIAGRCYIGEGAVIEPGAVIGEGAVIGSGAVIGHGACIEMSCIWSGCSVPPGRKLRHLVVIAQNGNATLRQILPYKPSQTT